MFACLRVVTLTLSCKRGNEATVCMTEVNPSISGFLLSVFKWFSLFSVLQGCLTKMNFFLFEERFKAFGKVCLQAGSALGTS